MSTPTITVDGFFGEKQVTREDFINQWVDHAAQLSSLDFEFWLELKPQVTEMAGKKFDRCMERELAKAS